MSNLFLWAFTLLLFIGNIYSFAKKKYLFLFVPCMLFLPEYYGIEISASLPLLSVRRIMYIVLFIYTAINKRRNISIKSLNIKDNANGYFFLAGYFVLRIISNLHYITTYGQAAKTIALLIFEQLCLLIAAYMLSPTQEDLVILIKSVVWVATSLFAIGIFESITSIRIFDALNTVSREVYNLEYYRLGVLRAQTTMYAPALYGNMCILIIPLILYLYNLEKSKRYLVAIALAILAVIHSGSRANMLDVVVIMMVYGAFLLSNKKRQVLFAKNGVAIIFLLLLYISLASFFSPKLKYFYVGTAKSTLNEIGFDFDLDADAPPNVVGFGGNPYGSASRVRQLTGIIGVAKRNPLFGMGSGAQTRGQIEYYWHFNNGKDGWITANSYDVGLVEIFCDEGMIGLLGICSVLIYLFFKARKCKFLMLAFICYLLSTLSTGNIYEFLMLYILLGLRKPLTV